jgi:glycosyltransferase involved in cell wall biosynthesis
MKLKIIGKSKNEWAEEILEKIKEFEKYKNLNEKTIIFSNTTSAILFTLVARAFFYKTIWIADGTKKNLITKYLLKIISFATYKIIAPNHAIETEYIKLGIKSEKILIIYPFQDLLEKSKNETHTIVACDGSIAIDDGLGIFLRAIASSMEIYKNIKIIIGGRAKDPNRIMWIAKTLGIKDSLQIMPQGNKTWQKSADIFVIPKISKEEAKPSIIYAMASGNAIISTNNIRHREFLEQNINGILIEPANMEMLSQSIINLAKNPKWINELGENNRRFAQKHFSKEKFNKTLELLIK